MKLYELDINPGSKQEISSSGYELGDRTEDRAKAEEYCKLIQENCKESLAAMRAGKEFLYRGSANKDFKAFKGASRENRRPLSTKAHYQVLLDEMLTQYGFTAIRSNSIYCTSNISEADYYSKSVGTTYMIFPIDGFKFTWSEYSGDLYALMNAADYRTLDDRRFVDFMDKFKFVKTRLNIAIQDGHEVMVHGQYYAFQTKYFYSAFKEILLGLS